MTTHNSELATKRRTDTQPVGCEEDYKMKRSPKLSYQDYRAACNEAFTANISNPTVFYSPTEGFYVGPSRNLVPNADTCLGLAYYSANSGQRSFTGSRREYRPIVAAIREFFSPTFNPLREYDAPATLYCEGADAEGKPCDIFNYGDKCEACGYQNRLITVHERITLKSLIVEYASDAIENAGGR